MLSLLVTSIKILILVNCWNLNEGHLIDYPLRPVRGSVTILSTLTDQSNQETYIVRETLIEHPKIHGKIEVTHRDHQIEVFHHEDYPSTRLVIHGNECHELEYGTNSWTEMIPTIDKPLLNTALLIGPSFYYRLVNRIDQAKADLDVDVRGEKLKSYRLKVENDLEVSFMFPVKFLVGDGLRQPKRLKLVSSSQNSETLLYDLHNEKQLTSFDETLASPTLGIGCSRYFSVNQPFPLVATQPYHVKIVETSKAINSDPVTTYKKMFVDPINSVSYVSTFGDQFDSGQTSFQTIIDYDLGIQYQLLEGKCRIMTIVPDREINPITMGIEDFKYVGQINYGHRSRYVDVWESIAFNVSENFNSYSKVVTTHFMFKQSNDSDSGSGSGYIPIAVERRFYKHSSDTLKLIESGQKDFFDYDEVNYGETDYRQSFQLTDCYDSPDDKMYLTVQISSEDTDNGGLGIAAKNVYSLRETIKKLISSKLGVSHLRITSINIELESSFIVARVEIIREPDLPSSLQSFDRKFSFNSFTNFKEVSVKGSVECLKVLSKEPVTHVISCMGLDNLCVGLFEGDKLPEANVSGSYCTVYENSFGTLKNLAAEVTLKQLTNRFTQLKGLHFELDCSDCLDQRGFKILNVVEDSPPLDVDEVRMLFKVVKNGAKLNDERSIMNFDASTFGDCYQACTSSNDLICETFSFCQSPVDRSSTECHLTGKVYGLLTNGTVSNSYCSIYAKNQLLDYHKITSTKFVDTRSGLTVRTEAECAQACSQSEEGCYSFQICDSRYCSFAGHLNSSNTIPDAFCAVYIPKRIHNYVRNSYQMVTSILHSEVDLTLDQCASLCSSTETDGHSNCKSFNYCPKGEATSICQLSDFTVSTSNSSQVSISDTCSNYEEKETIQQSTSRHEVQSNSMVGVVFVAMIGLIMGSATSWAHNRMKKRIARNRRIPSIESANDFAESQI